MNHQFRRTLALPTSAADAYAWHDRAGAFERLAPPWEPIRVLEPPVLRSGTRARFQMGLGPLWATWVARHEDVTPGVVFVDVQERGPFASWRHEHRFADEPGGAFLHDDVSYRLPLGPLGDLVAGRAIAGRLERMFAHRHAIVREDLMAHQAWGSTAPSRIALSGASGLVGSALAPFLTTGGHQVAKLSRRGASGPDDIAWSPARDEVDAAKLATCDAVVHLAGESVFGERWSLDKRARILQSRVQGTSLLARALARLPKRPRVLVCASAVGYYGDTGDSAVDESAGPGEGFLAEVCQAWEQAADPARDAGIRVVHLRFGVVLSPRGGALQKQLPLFRAGLGGPVGSGTQWLSFLGLDDALDIVLRAVFDERLEGPLNAVAPEAVTQADFARTLGRVLHRPALLRAPGFALRLALGTDQAEEMLLHSSRVLPGVLRAHGHRFRTPTLEGTLRRCLGRPRADSRENS